MSTSITPTRAPSSFSAAARLTATVDLPTPPLPDATAMTFLMPGARDSSGPRFAATCASHSISTVFTPSGRTAASMSSRILSLSGHAGVVSRIFVHSFEPVSSTPLTMSSSASVRPSSGSGTRPIAAKRASLLGSGNTGLRSNAGRSIAARAGRRQEPARYWTIASTSTLTVFTGPLTGYTRPVASTSMTPSRTLLIFLMSNVTPLPVGADAVPYVLPLTVTMQRRGSAIDASVLSAWTTVTPSEYGNVIVSPAGAPKNRDGTAVCVIVTCPLTIVASAFSSRFLGGLTGPGGGSGPGCTASSTGASTMRKPAAFTLQVAWNPAASTGPLSFTSQLRPTIETRPVVRPLAAVLILPLILPSARTWLPYTVSCPRVSSSSGPSLPRILPWVSIRVANASAKVVGAAPPERTIVIVPVSSVGSSR